MICNVFLLIFSHDPLSLLIPYLLCQTTHMVPICLAPPHSLRLSIFPMTSLSYCSPFSHDVMILVILGQLSQIGCYSHWVTVTTVAVYRPTVDCRYLPSFV